MKIVDSFEVWKEVFGKWKYSLSLILVALGFYSLNVAILNYNSFIEYYSMGLIIGTKFFIILFLGFKDTIFFHSFISLITISFFLGMLFSLIAYKTNMVKITSKNIGIFGTTGIFLGIIAPGCAACGIGILSLLGIGTAFLTTLPFEGLEISLLSIGILGISIIKVSQDIKRGIVCKI